MVNFIVWSTICRKFYLYKFKWAQKTKAITRACKVYDVLKNLQLICNFLYVLVTSCKCDNTEVKQKCLHISFTKRHIVLQSSRINTENSNWWFLLQCLFLWLKCFQGVCYENLLNIHLFGCHSICKVLL